MEDTVVKQEIEEKLREWKVYHDELEVLRHNAEKKLKEADAAASHIASNMKRLDLKKHKTYIGTLTIDDGVLKVSGHHANYKVPTPKKKTRSDSVQPTI